jgi:hypothetical protein
MAKAPSCPPLSRDTSDFLLRLASQGADHTAMIVQQPVEVQRELWGRLPVDPFNYVQWADTGMCDPAQFGTDYINAIRTRAHSDEYPEYRKSIADFATSLFRRLFRTSSRHEVARWRAILRGIVAVDNCGIDAEALKWIRG